jgi:hypothetical protein
MEREGLGAAETLGSIAKELGRQSKNVSGKVFYLTGVNKNP